jgi:hypothetical protein
MTNVVDPSTTRPGRGRPLAITAAAVVGVAAVVVAFLVTGRGKDSAATTGTTTTAPAPVTTVASRPDPSTLAAGEVLLEPVNVESVHPFSDSVAIGLQVAPTVTLPDISLPTTTSSLAPGQVPLAQVSGAQPGLYGGTRNMSACDKDRLITFLEANPAKAAAWASVQGIDPSAIRSFVTALTPVVLTRDTRVTNHGFVNGKAFAHPSVLQAGHAVLVDEYGVPRAQCSCGNPLLPPLPLAVTPTYVGTRWPTFDPTTIIVVVTGQKVPSHFVIVDLGTGNLLTRPTGFTTGQTDAAYVPASAAEDLVVVGNIGGIVPGAQKAARFTVAASTLVTSIANYHYGPQTPPGTVGLTAADGTFFGPWQTTGSDGQGGVKNATWTAAPTVVIPAGTYTVWDSEPSTWSTNDQAGGVGFTTVRGVVGVSDPPATGSAPTTMPAAATTTVPATTTPPATTKPPATTAPATTAPAATNNARQASLKIIDQLLLDCGYNVTKWTDGGGGESAWTWTATTSKGKATFVVFEPLGSFSVGTRDGVAAELAIQCGFNP